MSFAPGENVGAYRIVEQLGSGGMATVYKAYHAALDRYVALKVMHPAFKGDPNFLARFQREARVVARLDHPHIVPVYDFSEHKGSPYLVMRFVEGETLKARLEREQLTLPEILDVVRPMGEALTYAHEQGVLHRDIKPSNVLLSQHDRIFLTDFGLARIAQAGESSLTRDAMVGTPYYISPEQAIGKSELDARTDIYSFGVVLYQLFTGRVPFQSDTPFAVVHDHIYTPLPLPTSINPNLPPDLERVLLKAMAKEPDDRYDSALALVTAVEESVTGVAAIPPARPTPAPAPVPIPAPAETETAPPLASEELAEATVAQPPRQKRSWLLALGGLAAIAVIAILAVFLLTGKKEPGPESDQPVAERLSTTDTPDVEHPPTEEPSPTLQPTSPPEDAQSYFERGRELASQGDANGALKALQEATRLDPGFVPAYLDAARLLIASDNVNLAIETLARGVEINPQDPDLRLTLAQTYVFSERWEEAVPEFQWLLEHEPDMAEPHAYFGVYLAVEAGDADKAQAEIDRALTLDPESPIAHFAQGLYHLQQKDIRLAREELQRAQQSPRASPWLKQRIEYFLEERMGAEKTFKIGLVTDVGRIDDHSFNQSAWEGVLKAGEELGAEIQYIETQDAKDYKDNVRQFVDANFNVIVTVGFGLGDVTSAMAQQHPEIMFIAVDLFQVESLPNLTGLIFREDQAGYLAGFLAARLTRSGIIGAVLGSELVPSVVAFKQGYETGARATSPDIQIISTYHPGELSRAFTDPEWGKATAAQMIDQGADVIFAAAGLTGYGALDEIAVHPGLLCIGVDNDQWNTVPSARPCLVSSAIKLITPGVFDLIMMARESSFPGGNYFGGVGLAPFHDFEEQIPQDVKGELERIAAGLKEGSISTGYGE